MYLVKTMNDGRHGVYDTERACFPVETPDLRAAGLGRVEWFPKGNEGRAEAERIAAHLNEFHGHVEHATKALKAAGKAAEQATDSMRDLADALIADQAGA